MATPKETVWKADPHTFAKHAIVRKYLDAWFRILGSTQGRVLYLDGFCGPGEYKGGEPGSPLIALRSAEPFQDGFKGEAVFYFVDEDCRRIEHLESKLGPFRSLPRFHIKTECEEFEHVLSKVLDELDSSGMKIAPTFAFIDPFGFKGLPMKLIHRLLAHEKTETFINFNLDGVNRFIQHPDPKIQEQIVELFGTDEVIEIIQRSSNRPGSLRALYQRRLGMAADYVRFFSMNDKHDRPIYDLFFAGNHYLGHLRMKEAMWNVDPRFGLRFSDATDPDQALLFQADAVPQLLPSILSRYKGRSAVTVEEIRDWVRDETGFLPQHLNEALKQSEGERFIIKERHADGSKRRKGSYKEGAIIDFTHQHGKQESLF